MVSDVSMGNANLMTAVNTSVLKKSMDTNEALMNELIERYGRCLSSLRSTSF